MASIASNDVRVIIEVCVLRFVLEDAGFCLFEFFYLFFMFYFLGSNNIIHRTSVRTWLIYDIIQTLIA